MDTKKLEQLEKLLGKRGAQRMIAAAEKRSKAFEEFGIAYKELQSVQPGATKGFLSRTDVELTDAELSDMWRKVKVYKPSITMAKLAEMIMAMGAYQAKGAVDSAYNTYMEARQKAAAHGSVTQVRTKDTPMERDAFWLTPSGKTAAKEAAPKPATSGREVNALLSSRRGVKSTKHPFWGGQVRMVDTPVLTITYGQKGWGGAVKQAAVADIGDAIRAMMDVLKVPSALVDQMIRRSGQEATYDMLKAAVEAQGGTVELNVEVRKI